MAAPTVKRPALERAQSTASRTYAFSWNSGQISTTPFIFSSRIQATSTNGGELAVERII